MNFSSKLSGAVGCLLLSLLSGPTAHAATMTGMLSSDDQTASFNWNLAQSSNVVAYTNSYASGGFVPVVSLFDVTSGNLVAVDGGDASCSNGRMMDSTTGICNDAYLAASLAKGSYVVVLSEFFNYPGATLSAPFSEAGAGDFTSGVCGTTGGFWETDLAPCVQRTNNYSLTLSSASTATPEPSTVWLTLPVLAVAVYRLRKSATRAKKLPLP